MKATLTLEFNSKKDLTEFIERINPVIRIAYDDSEEVHALKQELYHLDRRQNAPVQYLIAEPESLQVDESLTDKLIQEYKQIVEEFGSTIRDQNLEILKLQAEKDLLSEKPATCDKAGDDKPKEDSHAQEIITAGNTPRFCQECSNPIPGNKRTPFCSNRCYHLDYDRRLKSKKAKKTPKEAG